MDCDTFDHIPDHLCSAVIIDELIFTRLRCYVGAVFTGLASPGWNNSNSSADWGRAIALNSQDTLQMRIHPRGLLSAGRLLDMDTSTVLLAARRRTAGVCKESVSLAVLWHPGTAGTSSECPFNPLKETSQPVATRNLHIVVPSLFNHHDAQHASCKKKEWPFLDLSNFHAVRPGSFTIHRPVKLPGGGQIVTATAATGVSQFIIAGQLAGVDVDDQLRRTSESLMSGKWDEMVDAYSATLVETCGQEVASAAMFNSLSVTDLLSCEGLLGILGHQFVSGALPDMMHNPGGFPLLISFAVRLACYPKRYGLVAGNDADQLATREIISLFEGNWEPVAEEQSATRNMYVIDLAIEKAFAEARDSAKRQDALGVAVQDNIIFWHRAGQRCLTAILGPQTEDFSPVVAHFGLCDKVVDPLAEARNRVIQRQMHPGVVANRLSGHTSLSMATQKVKRSVLLTMMNSVEHWLRTGEYAGMQLHKENTVSVRTKRSSNAKSHMTKGELMEALMQGAEDSAADMIASGEAASEEEAHHAANRLREGILAAMDAGENDVSVKIPPQLAGSLGVPIDGQEKKAKHWGENICSEAFKSGINGISSAMCDGPLVHHEYKLSIFLSSEGAVNLCADCNALVHLLTATFFSPSTASCPTCARARCSNCASAAHQQSRSGKSPPVHCLRCKPVISEPAAASPSAAPAAPAAPSEAPAETRRKPSAKGSRKKKQATR
jgi:hypothetical protein